MARLGRAWVGHAIERALDEDTNAPEERGEASGATWKALGDQGQWLRAPQK